MCPTKVQKLEKNFNGSRHLSHEFCTYLPVTARHCKPCQTTEARKEARKANLRNNTREQTQQENVHPEQILHVGLLRLDIARISIFQEIVRHVPRLRL